MKLAINEKYSDVLIQLKERTGKGVSQLLYEALEDLKNKHTGVQYDSKQDSKSQT